MTADAAAFEAHFVEAGLVGSIPYGSVIVFVGYFLGGQWVPCCSVQRFVY
jgi:hypothetical protein